MADARQTSPGVHMRRRSAILGVTVLAAATSLAACDSACANRVLRELPSPDGSRRAVIFDRDCGATTGFSTQVSVVGADDVPAGTGNVFIADSNHGAAPEMRGRTGGGGAVARPTHPRGPLRSARPAVRAETGAARCGSAPRGRFVGCDHDLRPAMLDLPFRGARSWPTSPSGCRRSWSCSSPT